MSSSVADLLHMHPGLLETPPKILQALRETGQEDHLLVYAWELARLPDDLDPVARKGLFVLALTLLVVEGQGHTRMGLVRTETDPGWAFLRACGQEGLEPRSILMSPGMDAMVGRPGEVRPMIVDGEWLYLNRLHRAETYLAMAVQGLVSAAFGHDPVIPEDVFNHPVELSEEQKGAVLMALTRSLALITGGAGTGKTSIVVAILRSLLHQPGFDLNRVALAAPTGKAAQRMGEAIRHALDALPAPGQIEVRLREELPEPKTLHRLLGWHPALARFRHSDENPLAADVLIVDEASMVGSELMENLIRALPANGRLVLIGDADQLPSVEAGCVFRDLVKGLPGNTQGLTQSYRMRVGNPAGRHVLAVANAVNEGREKDLWNGVEALRCRGGADDVEFQGVEYLEAGVDGFRPFLDRWFREFVVDDGGFLLDAARVYRHAPKGWALGDLEALDRLFKRLGSGRILCVLKAAGELRGVESINALLHGWMQPLTGQGLRHDTPFFAGEPVMATSNDYQRGIFNGDQGVVLKVELGGDLKQAAVFPSLEGPRVFVLDSLRGRLDLCHAMTVHKSQGSEFDQVAVVLPKGSHPALSREVLYTAITRARQSSVVLGERESFEFAVQNPGIRLSGLGEKLGQA